MPRHRRGRARHKLLKKFVYRALVVKRISSLSSEQKFSVRIGARAQNWVGSPGDKHRAPQVNPVATPARGTKIWYNIPM